MVYKRGGNWHTYVTYKYVDANGVPRQRRIRRKIGPRRGDAVEAETQIRAQIAAGTYDPDPVEPTLPVMFADFCEEEFLPWSKTEHSASHHDNLQRMLRVRWMPYLADHSLAEVTTKQIEDYKSRRKGEAYKGTGWGQSKRTSAATVNRELAAIKVVYRQAVAWGRVTASPAAGVSALKEPPNPPRLLSGDEVARLIHAMPDHLRAVVVCAVYAGLRKSETLRLRWRDIDMKAGVLAVVSREGRRTKSNKDRRIPINAEMRQLLSQHPQKLGSAYVFPGTTGHLTTIRKSLNAAAKRAGLDHVTMHQLRHAFCSHAQMRGVPARTVQMWMGHADLGTTLRYSHTADDHERTAIQRISYRVETGEQAEEESGGI